MQLKARLPWRVGRWAFWLAVVLLGISGCAPIRSAQVAPTATATLAPTATTIPLPTATPLPSVANATTAGWRSLTDPHWCGYTFPQGNLTGIRAEWQEPTVTAQTGAEEFTWIGIGGWNETGDNLIQVGTFAYFPSSGGIHQGMWYETIPPNIAQFPLIGVSPGDTIFASIELVQPNPQTWHMQVIDETTQATLDKTMQYQSVETYADYVVEDPNETQSSGPPYYPLPSFSPVAFSNMQVRVGSFWVATNAYYGYQITMERNGRTVSTPGALNGASFTVTYG